MFLYFLDKNGNLSQIKNPLGKVQSFEYDKKNRVIEKKWNSGKITKYSYDGNANVIIKQDILNYKNKLSKTLTRTVEVIERDYNDSHREIAPLKPAEDGVILDTTGLSLEESIASIVKIVKENI